MKMNKVVLSTFDEKKLDEIVEKGFEEVGLKQKLTTAKKVCIKPNLVTDNKEYIKNGANTDIRIIKAVLRYLMKYEVKIIIGEADSGTGVKGRKLNKTLDFMGVTKLQEKYDFDIVNFTKDDLVDYNIEGGKYLKEVKLGKSFVESDIIINLPKLKTHKYATITCALKNMFGVIPDPLRIRYHENIHRTIADLSMHLMNKTFVLTDAIIAMEGKGPIYGDPVEMGLLMFSNSMYCNDLVACKLMGFNRRDIKHLQYVSEYLSEDEKEYELIEFAKLTSFKRKFKPARKNLYIFVEGKLMQNPITLRLFHNKWFQQNISYRLRKILRKFRGGSSTWYIKKK